MTCRRCGESSEKSLCQECASKQRIYSQRYKTKARMSNLCLSCCKNPALADSQSQCQTCKEKAAKRKRLKKLCRIMLRMKRLDSVVTQISLRHK